MFSTCFKHGFLGYYLMWKKIACTRPLQMHTLFWRKNCLKPPLLMATKEEKALTFYKRLYLVLLATDVLDNLRSLNWLEHLWQKNTEVCSFCSCDHKFLSPFHVLVSCGFNFAYYLVFELYELQDTLSQLCNQGNQFLQKCCRIYSKDLFGGYWSQMDICFGVLRVILQLNGTLRWELVL